VGIASGGIQTDEGRIEILGRRIPVGRRIETPEGWFRVEEAGPEDDRVGSFAVVSAASFAAFGAESEGEPAPGAGEPAPAAPAAGPDCRTERSAYLAELWRMSGIEDVKDPEAVIRGLEGDTFAPGLGLWLALSTDPIRPLAWSSALRDRAAALARCERAR
jgi:hypothetical protein